MLLGFELGAMASRYQEGLSHNQKRKVRRTLQQRLHLAEHDAGRDAGSGSGAASGSADGGAVAQSSQGTAGKGAEGSSGTQQRDRAPGAGLDSGVFRSTPSCPPYLDHPEDRPQKLEGLCLEAAPSRLGMRGDGQHGRKREAEPLFGQAKRTKQEETREEPAAAPWRGGGADPGALWGSAVAVRPRWQVERDLDAAQKAASRLGTDGRHFEQLLSKAATALLRWGRADLVSPGGGFRTVALRNWTSGSWHEVDQLAEALHVDIGMLWNVLCSTGRRGPRVEVDHPELHAGSCARALWCD